MKKSITLRIEFFKKTFVTIVVIFIGVLMIFAFSFPDAMLGRKKQVVGKINGKAITFSKGSSFFNHYQQMRDYYQEQGVEVSKDLDPFLMQQAFNRAVFDELLFIESKNHFIYIENKDIISMIKGRYFVDSKTGVFNQAAYNRFKTEGDFNIKKKLEVSTKKALQRGYLDYMLFSFVPVHHLESSKKITDREVERKAIIATKDFSQEAKKNISEKDLVSFYNQNKQIYSNQSYKIAKSKVFLDYYEKNKLDILTRLKSQFLQSIQNTLKTDKFKNNFFTSCTKLGFRVVETDFFNIDATELYTKNGNALSIEDFPRVIGNLFSVGIKLPTQVLETSSSVLIAYPLVQRRKKISLRQSKNMKDELLKEKKQRVTQAFQTHLYKKAKVVSYLDQDVSSK